MLVNDISLIQEGFTTVQVVFNKNSSSEYTYKVPLSWGVVVDDYLIVPAKDSFALVLVNKVDEVPQIPNNSNFHLRWAVQKVDFSLYNELKAKEAELVNILKMAEAQAKRNKMLDTIAQYYGDDISNKVALLNKV